MAVQEMKGPELGSPGGGCAGIPRPQAYQTNEVAIKVGRCSRCGRPLRDPASVERGMGPICAARASADRAMRESTLTVVITVNGLPLHHVVRHSPTGMEWGYGGSGPADLALSILCHYLGDRELAEQLHQQFKWDFVARFPREGWRLLGEQIHRWLLHHGVAVPKRAVVYEGRRGPAGGGGAAWPLRRRSSTRL